MTDDETQTRSPLEEKILEVLTDHDYNGGAGMHWHPSKTPTDQALVVAARIAKELAVDRETVDRAVGEVLFNASNYPEQVQVHILGRDIGPLRTKVTDAVLAATTSAFEGSQEGVGLMSVSQSLEDVRDGRVRTEQDGLAWVFRYSGRLRAEPKFLPLLEEGLIQVADNVPFTRLYTVELTEAGQEALGEQSRPSAPSIIGEVEHQPTRAQGSTLESVQRACATTSKDMALVEGDAILWGLLLGWDSQGDGESSYPDLMKNHVWDEDFVARLRRAHAVMTAPAIEEPQVACVLTEGSDVEDYASGFNEGYETAMGNLLVDDGFFAAMREVLQQRTSSPAPVVGVPQIGDLALHASGMRRDLGLDDSDPFVVVGVRQLTSGEVQVKVRMHIITPWTPVDAFTYTRPQVTS